MSMRSPLGRVRGLGSAKEGVGHWWAERMTALALVPLTVWFVASVVALAGSDYQAVRDWMASPVVAGLLLLLIVMVFYHAALGVQVVIEDYLAPESLKFAAVIAEKAVFLVLGLVAALAVLRVLLGA